MVPPPMMPCLREGGNDEVGEGHTERHAVALGTEINALPVASLQHHGAQQRSCAAVRVAAVESATPDVQAAVERVVRVLCLHLKWLHR